MEDHVEKVAKSSQILGGIADTCAQTLTSFRMRQAAKRRESSAKDQMVSIEIRDMDKKSPLPQYEYVPNTRDLPPPFDFERLTRFMAYGFIMSPVQFHWFKFLSNAFPLTKTSITLPAFKRMACDQLIFAPIGLAAFFSFMTVAEGGGRRAISRKFQDVYLPSLKANWIIWPAVQILNFRVVPIQFQIVSTWLGAF